MWAQAALFRRATFAACLPSAVRVFFGRCAMVLFFFAAAVARLMFLFAAVRCFSVAMETTSILAVIDVENRAQVTSD